MSGKASGGGRSVASRVLTILDSFDFDHRRLTLSDIARRSGVPIATAHRLLADLVEWRALERDASGHYHVGLRLWEVGLLAPLSADLREIALPFLQDLYEGTRENVHLAVRDGFEAMYVEKLSGHRSVPILSRVGGRFPLHSTGVGKALLAYETQEFVERYLARPLERHTRYTITEPGRLHRELALARRRGYAVTREEHTLGSCSVAVPVLDERERPLAAVGVVVRTTRVEPSRLVPPTRLAAAGIAARIAAPRDEPYHGRPEAQAVGDEAGPRRSRGRPSRRTQ